MTQHNIPKWLSGNNNVICDVCGKKRKRSECVVAYGSGTIPVVMSCRDGCADYDHPLNYPPPTIFDGRPVPDARPDVYGNQIAYVMFPNNSLMSWGHLRNSGSWSHFNGQNNQFQTDPIWTWGNFSSN
jgi:hypothetical protein